MRAARLAVAAEGIKEGTDERGHIGERRRGQQPVRREYRDPYQKMNGEGGGESG